MRNDVMPNSTQHTETINKVYCVCTELGIDFATPSTQSSSNVWEQKL